jgi:hypothetical protein
MECAYHQNHEPVGTCHECGRFICVECKNIIAGNIYCLPCSDKLFVKQEPKVSTPTSNTEQQKQEILPTTKTAIPTANEQIKVQYDVKPQLISVPPMSSQKDHPKSVKSSTTMNSHMTCPSCRNLIEHDDIFCVKCGHRLDATSMVIEAKSEPTKSPTDISQREIPSLIVADTHHATTVKSLPSLQQNIMKPDFSIGGFLKPWTRLLAIICGVMLIISLFLVWLSPSEKLGSQIPNATGINVSPIILIMGIILSLAVIAASIVLNRRISGIVTLAAGALALTIVLIIVLTSRLPLLSAYARTLIVMREGFYLYVILSTALLVLGIIDLQSARRR